MDAWTIIRKRTLINLVHTMLCWNSLMLLHFLASSHPHHHENLSTSHIAIAVLHLLLLLLLQIVTRA
jgi:hypothetical protein